MATSCYNVTRTSTGLVAPCAPTPSDTLPLSFMDKIPGLRFVMEVIQIFTYGEVPAKRIRAALARALVPYYPVAGRLVQSSEGELQVSCTGEGVWFAEATADFSLEDVDHLSQPLKIPSEDLLPVPGVKHEHPNVILVMQVTNFTCGGFAVCVGFDHTMFDGIGIMQFLRAMGDMARGLERPIAEPIWCREAIVGPYTHAPGSTPPLWLINYKLKWCTLDINQDAINQIKTEFLKETGQRCTTFDVVVAIIWQCRTRAIRPKPQAMVRINCMVNARPFLHGLLPSQEGYYGNCIFAIKIIQEAGKVMGMPLGEVLRLVLDAKAALKADFWKWMKGVHQEERLQDNLAYETMTLTDFRRIGGHWVDYGWGPPLQTSITKSSEYSPPVVALIDPPPPKDGVRIVGRLVQEEHLVTFHDEIARLAGATSDLRLGARP